MADAEQKAKIAELFKNLDKDKKGTLDKEEIKIGIKQIYSEINLFLTDADIDHMIQLADVNGDDLQRNSGIDFIEDVRKLNLTEIVYFTLQKNPQIPWDVPIMVEENIKKLREIFKLIMLKLNAIAAMCDYNNGIGLNKMLPWQLEKEFAYFLRFISVENCSRNKVNALVVGRLTWESIPENMDEFGSNIIVIVSSLYHENKDRIDYKSYDKQKVFIVEHFEDAIELVYKNFSDLVESIIAIGGTKIYSEALRSSSFNRLYLTRIFEQFECDTFMEPKNFLTELKLLNNENVEEESKKYKCIYNLIQSENNVNYVFEVYEKK